MKAVRRVGTTVGLILLVSGLVACSPSPEEVAAEVAADRVAVLDKYLASEQMVLDDLVRETSIYQAGSVTGAFEGDPGAVAFPSTIVTFTYTYIENVRFGGLSGYQPSWAEPSRPQAELDTMKLSLLSACNTILFPAMRAVGLTGALQVEYVYMNPPNPPYGSNQSWSLTCTAPAV